MDKIVYTYEPNTKVYIGQTIAQRSPADEDEIYLMPPNALEIAPPATGDNEIAVADGQTWRIEADFRDKLCFDQTTGEVVTITTIGPLPANIALTLPLESQKTHKRTEINSYWSSANNSSFEFQGKAIGCDTFDRSNLDATCSYISLYGVFNPEFSGKWKAQNGEWIDMPNVDVFKAMYAVMVAQGTANFMKAQMLKDQVIAAETSEQVAAIVW